MINTQKLKMEEWNLPHSPKFWIIYTLATVILYLISKMAPEASVSRKPIKAGCLNEISQSLQYSCADLKEKNSPILVIQTGELESLSGYFAIEGAPKFQNNSEMRNRVFLLLEVNLFLINSSGRVIETLEL